MDKVTKLFLKDLLKLMDKHNVTMWCHDVGKDGRFTTEYAFTNIDYNVTAKQNRRIYLKVGQVEGKVK